jgi:HlyD family secretion protein
MRKWAWAAGGVVLAGALTLLWARRDAAHDDGAYRFVTVERGDLESVVSASGTLQPLSTVRVGTQVSGIIAKTLVDFNDRVREGQTIAQIDTTLLAGAVQEAKAELERAKAELRHRETEFERVRSLHEGALAADTELNLAQYNLDVARASEESAEVSLDRAARNVEYATIRAPITGTVIERNVDVGQTVAASFSAPQLFLIADDLSRMQILASVDESDIGQIREGQTARFTVQAYPDSAFTGTVRQVRMQSTTLENVVNYSVVVDVANPERKLLPGMTATVDFIVGVAKDVTKVPNAALRFRASPEMVAEVQKRRDERAASLPDSVRSRMAERRERRSANGAGAAAAAASAANGAGSSNRASAPLLWYVDDAGRLAAARVRAGITDGRYTEVEGRDIHEGMQVISGIARSGATTASSNPLQPQSQTPPRGPGGF